MGQVQKLAVVSLMLGLTPENLDGEASWQSVLSTSVVIATTVICPLTLTPLLAML